jgi:hypothetical protein
MPNNANCGVIEKSINHAKKSEAHRAFCFFGGFAWYTMTINHRRSYIAMTQHGLYRPNNQSSSTDTGHLPNTLSGALPQRTMILGFILNSEPD